MQANFSCSNDAARLAAVRRRDPAADRQFLYSVASTGVFCYPSCAARPALAHNIGFHESRAAAERAGFRPCKRCRPDLPPRAEREARVVETACRRIEQAEEVPSLAALAAHVRLSPQHFHRLFRRIAGITPKAYAAAHRQSRVQRELAAGSRVTDTIYNSGFNSTGRFYAAAGEMLGMKPSQYRRGGAGESIRYTMRRSSIGIVLVAATERGICAILLGDERDALLSELTARFPKAKITLAKREFAAWVRQIVGMLDHPQQVPPALPLDIRGTAFQRRVWQVLRTIPAGQTLSYTEVAERIGQSAAVRAVAGACAANPLAVAIPCHRVLAAGGKLSGYRWGIERKRQLLKRESIVVAE